ncbi:uncharacterized protein MONOS_13193 [Monocercomonoides exilis]|uniref:uncharacterized protein n=1 Tax=Monocercomonoides exilis TaxID=2049356 RepID=UPI0035596AA0|nr:hypothetical protein MONOS_13193 [Monocercomonoides exilis]|eukprot:MONOS_13193.1-p1 / transcript=MONOS_13193.1 / gene=MONOS_13193 / organism=Monocercomonoides_exilis_PA203 / gene_product=unspecified product / transcript_product=unspecified product / location=Mono_scaffold00788:21602-22704(-) / protein_length=134 / sequence_SO=supercontig / SO=protein_coding / is_pseudo=false
MNRLVDEIVIFFMEMRESSSKGAVDACSLPDDILKIIFGKCNFSTIISLSQVNRRFNILSKTEECARIKCRAIIPFMHKICLLPECAFQYIYFFNPRSEEDWKESYKYGVSAKGWKETLQVGTHTRFSTDLWGE